MSTTLKSDIGTLDRRVTLYTLSTAADAYGAAGAETWTSAGEVWAHYEMGTGIESLEGAAQAGLDIVYFTLRKNTASAITSKLIYASKEYDIISVEEVGRNNYQRLKCKLRL